MKRTTLTAGVVLGTVLTLGAALATGAATARAAGSYTAIVVNNQYPTSDSATQVTGSGSSWVHGSPLVLGSGNIGLTSIAYAPDGATAYQAVAAENAIVPIATPAFTAGTPFSSVVTNPIQDAVTPNGTHLLVTGSGNQLAVISTANPSVAKTVTVGNGAFAIAVTPDSSKAFITNGSDNTVSEVSLVGTPTVIKTITFSACNSPGYEAMAPNGKTLWVVCASNNFLWKVTVATGVPAASGIAIPTGGAAGEVRQVVITPAGQRAYVASDKKVYPVNLGTSAVGKGIAVTNNTWSLAISRDGAYILAGGNDLYTDVVKVIQVSSNTVVHTFSAGGYAHFSIQFQP